MAEPKTKATEASVEAYLGAIGDPARRRDCERLAELMAEATAERPVMWGTGIVGFGRYHYRYESGHEGDACLAGFASRKGDISIYLMGGFPEREALLARLGRHRMGKACLQIRRLSEIDLEVLTQLVSGSVAALRRRYGAADSRTPSGHG